MCLLDDLVVENEDVLVFLLKKRGLYMYLVL